MFEKFTRSGNINFIMLDVQNVPKAKKIYECKKTNTERPQAEQPESEWQQEYKLIYDSQKLEDRNHK